MSLIEELRLLFPGCSRPLDELRWLREIIDGLSMEPFFEPISVIDANEGDKRKRVGSLLSLDAVAMANWAAHVSNGSRARMHSLEAAFLEQLLQKRVLSAMVISRAHMESAALAAYAENILVECDKKGNWDKMRTVIPKMLFGTSFALEQKAHIQDQLDWSAQEPIQIMDAIDAMDRFAESTGAPLTHRFRVQYAWLCEYAHPTMGSTRGFFDVVEEKDTGWILKYKYDEGAPEADVKAVLTMTIESMRVGYANVLILNNTRFEDSAHGIVYNSPPTEFGQWIWDNILQGANKEKPYPVA